MWLLLAAFVVGEVVYLVVILLSYSLSENQQEVDETKLPNSILLICASVFTVSLVVFMVSASVCMHCQLLTSALPQALLASRLDGSIGGPYSAILVSLHVALLCLLASTFTRYPSNPCECDSVCVSVRVCVGELWSH